MRHSVAVVIGVLGLCALAAGCGGHQQANRSSTTTAVSSTTSPPPAPATWTTRSVPAGVGGLNGVTCPSATQCDAVGGAQDGPGPGWIIASSDGGEAWKVLDSASQSWFSAIACPTTTRCVAIGGMNTGQGDALPVVVATVDGGQQWTPAVLPSDAGVLSDVACASSTVCVAVGSGNGYLRTTDGGGMWTLVPAASGLSSPDSVTCPTTSFCIVGGAGPGPEASSPSIDAVSHDGGLSWSTATTAGGPSGLGQISCSDAQTCVGLIESGATNTAGTGSPVVTSDGGSTWTRGSDPSGLGDAVSCVRDVCVSVGGMYQFATNTYPGDVFRSTDGGRDWKAMSIATPQMLTGVACPTSTVCVAVGGGFPTDTSGVIVTYGP